ncbi:hypothetical protein [Chitinophaga defluvii]|uniref:Uncharacterized protein n=1 Tax=Chitinophaga defluvii TaxID=3163343 RepID=A0ABV2TCG4_9BACT
MLRNSEQQIDAIVKGIKAKGYVGWFWEKGRIVDLSEALTNVCIRGFSSLQLQTFVQFEESDTKALLCKFNFENTRLHGIRLRQFTVEQRNTNQAKLLVAHTININRLSDIPNKPSVVERINGPNMRVKKSRYRI